MWKVLFYFFSSITNQVTIEINLKKKKTTLSLCFQLVVLKSMCSSSSGSRAATLPDNSSITPGLIEWPAKSRAPPSYSPSHLVSRCHSAMNFNALMQCFFFLSFCWPSSIPPSHYPLVVLVCLSAQLMAPIQNIHSSNWRGSLRFSWTLFTFFFLLGKQIE